VVEGTRLLIDGNSYSSRYSGIYVTILVPIDTLECERYASIYPHLPDVRLTLA
jgi:hypothetical protein